MCSGVDSHCVLVLCAEGSVALALVNMILIQWLV